MKTQKEKKISPSRAVHKTSIKRPRWKPPIEFTSIVPAQIKEENRWNEEFIERISKSSYNKGFEAGKSETITLINNELRALYFLVKKGHDERIEAEIKVLEKLKGELAK